MTLPSKPVVVRLPGELAQRFDRLQEEFGGLQPSAILRMLIAAQLERPLPEQVEEVTRQIRKPKGARTQKPNSTKPGLNAKNRISDQ